MFYHNQSKDYYRCVTICCRHHYLGGNLHPTPVKPWKNKPWTWIAISVIKSANDYDTIGWNVFLFQLPQNASFKCEHTPILTYQVIICMCYQIAPIKLNIFLKYLFCGENWSLVSPSISIWGCLGQFSLGSFENHLGKHFRKHYSKGHIVKSYKLRFIEWILNMWVWLCMWSQT